MGGNVTQYQSDILGFESALGKRHTVKILAEMEKVRSTGNIRFHWPSCWVGVAAVSGWCTPGQNMLLSRFSRDPEDKIRALSGGDEKQAATHSPRGFDTISY